MTKIVPHFLVTKNSVPDFFLSIPNYLTQHILHDNKQNIVGYYYTFDFRIFSQQQNKEYFIYRTKQAGFITTNIQIRIDTIKRGDSDHLTKKIKEALLPLPIGMKPTRPETFTNNDHDHNILHRNLEEAANIGSFYLFSIFLIATEPHPNIYYVCFFPPAILQPYFIDQNMDLNNKKKFILSFCHFPTFSQIIFKLGPSLYDDSKENLPLPKKDKNIQQVPNFSDEE